MRAEVVIDRSGSDAEYRFRTTTYASGLTPAVTGFARAAVRPYEPWRQAHFTAAQLADPGVAGDGADPDSDGLPNLAEYAMALAPLTPDAAGALVPVIDLWQGQPGLQLRFRQARPPRSDVRVFPEFSADLQAGSWKTNGVELLSDLAMDAFSTVTVRAPSTVTPGSTGFLRLRFDRLP